MCLGRCLFASRSIPYTVQLDPVAGLWLWLPLSCCFSSSRLKVCRTVGLAGGGQGLVDGRLEAAHMLHGGTVCLYGLHVLVQDGKDLIVQDLVLPDSVCHFLQGHILNDFILPVLPLYFQQVVTEVEQVEATLLAQQDDDGAASPVQAITKTLLSCELVGPHGNAVDELHGTPQPVEFHTLVNVHDAVGGWRAPPDGVLQVASNAGQNDLKHGQAAAQPLLGQQVTLPSDGNLLRSPQPLYQGDQVKWGILGFQAFHPDLQTLPLFDVDSRQDILEGCSMEQITDFLLRLQTEMEGKKEKNIFILNQEEFSFLKT